MTVVLMELDIILNYSTQVNTLCCTDGISAGQCIYQDNIKHGGRVDLYLQQIKKGADQKTGNFLLKYDQIHLFLI